MDAAWVSVGRSMVVRQYQSGRAMIASSLVLLSNQMALQRTMDVIANNVANANTTAFKRENVEFSSYLAQPSQGPSTNFVVDRATYRDISVGPIEPTHNALDLAIQGQGYFQVRTKDGTRYTRSGSFQLDNQGQITTHKGDVILSDGGQAIAVPDNATDINIASDGTVTAKLGNQPALSQLGKISVVQFEKEQAMQMEGGNLYSTTQPSIAATNSTIVQGALEKSNVQPVTEMTHMIEVMRLYERSSNIIKQDNSRMLDALNRLSKTSV